MIGVSRRRRALVRGSAVVSLCIAGLVLACPHRAFAYVRYRASPPLTGGLGAPYAWGSSSLNILGYPHGLPTMPVEQIGAAMTAAVAAWSKEDPTNATCSFLGLTLSLQSVDAIAPAAGHDDVNTIALRDGVWTEICTTMKSGAMVCHQPGELALTTVWSRGCGQIVEADVEVNADASTPSAFMWADLDSTTTNGGYHDLQNALTHEMGHFIGLDHTCELAPGAAAGEVDNLGNPVPDCSDATLAEMDATMYPSSEAGDLSKRTLSQDDRDGLCGIYPLGTTPVTCGVGSGSSGGCAVSLDDAAANGPRAVRWFTVIGAALALGALIAARRRRS